MKNIDKQELTNTDIVLYALYVLDGHTRKVPTEKIAVKSYELYPQRFSWRLYPEYPDLEVTRLTLKNLTHSKTGKMIIGRSGKATADKVSDGWMLTPRGIGWMEENNPRISQALNIKTKSSSRTLIDRKISELEDSAAYKIFLRDGSCKNIKPYDFTDFLNASLDTPSAILREHADMIRGVISANKHEQLIHFFEELEKHFTDLLQVNK